MLRNVRLWEQSEIKFGLNFEAGFVVGAGLISRYYWFWTNQTISGHNKEFP